MLNQQRLINSAQSPVLKCLLPCLCCCSPTDVCGRRCARFNVRLLLQLPVGSGRNGYKSYLTATERHPMSTNPATTYRNTVASNMHASDKDFLQAVTAGECLIVVTYPAGSTAGAFLDRMVAALPGDKYRVLRVAGDGDAPMELKYLIDQVVGPDLQNGMDRVETFYNTLTLPAAAETRLVLIIDDAHRLTRQALAYLDLLGSIDNLANLRFQLVLTGLPSVWGQLPETGRLAAGNVTTRLSLGSGDASPDPDHVFPIVSAAPPVAPGVASSDQADPQVRSEKPKAVVTSDTVEVGAISEITAIQTSDAQISGTPLSNTRSRRLAWAASIGIIVLGTGMAAVHQFPGGSSLVGTVPQVNAMPAPQPEQAPVTGIPPEPSTADAVGAAPTETASGSAAATVTEPAEPVASASFPVSSGMATEPVLPAAAAEDGPVQAEAVSPPPPAAPAPATQIAASPGPMVLTTKEDHGSTALRRSVSPGIVAMLLDRGNALLATGDLSAARAMYERAADADSGQAAAALGMTYDPRFLAQIGVQGMEPDPKRAIAWYQRASGLGSAEGQRLLIQLQTAGGTR